MKEFLVKNGDVLFVFTCLLFIAGILVEFYVTKTPIKLMPY